MSTSCTTITTTSCCPSPANNCPPSPTPPWARQPFRIGTQVLTDAGAIDITRPITLLQQAVVADPPYAITIADGTYVGQPKQIMIPGDFVGYETTWALTGTFVGLTSLLFTQIGFNCELTWDGTGWQVSGNVEQVA